MTDYQFMLRARRELQALLDGLHVRSTILRRRNAPEFNELADAVDNVASDVRDAMHNLQAASHLETKIRNGEKK